MRRQRLASIAAAGLVSLALAALALFLFTRNNDFPLSYHPDEWSKVDQIQSRTHARNLHHPLLMVEAADVARQWFHVPVDDDRAVAIAGRWTSATLASVGVLAACLAGFVAHRWIGLAVVGPTIALCPPLLVYAHYLKEDATFVGGLLVATLGARLVLSTRRARSQLPATIVLALGCAMAASGKYVGVAALVPALLALVVAPLGRWWLWPSRVVVFALIATAATVAINARAFDDPWRLKPAPIVADELHENYDHVTGEHDGLALAVPSAFCLRVAARETMPHVWTLAALGAISVVVARRRWPISRWSIVLASFPVTFAIVLSHNVIPFERYALPITVFVYVLAANLAAAGLRAIARPGIRVAATAIASLVVIVAQGDRCVRFDRQFADDGRQRLRDWLAANVPPGTVVLADWYADLYSPGDPWRFPEQRAPQVTVRGNGYAGSNGTLDRVAAARGIRYVVAVDTSYKRFFAPGIRAVNDPEWLERVRSFYRDLFARGELVWSSAPDPPSHAYVSPDIRVYRIDRLTKPSVEPPPPPTVAERWLKLMAERKAATSQPAK